MERQIHNEQPINHEMPETSVVGYPVAPQEPPRPLLITDIQQVRAELSQLIPREAGESIPDIVTSQPIRADGPSVTIQEKQTMRIRRKTEAKIASEGIEGLKERHLMMGDAQFPDQDNKAIGAVMAFNKDYKATHIQIMGDMLNATTVGSYDVPRGTPSFWSEIQGARKMLKDIVDRAREANPEVKINYYEGNHCYRLQKFVDKNAQQLAELEDLNGDRVLAMENLLGLKEMGVNWVPYWEDGEIGKHTTVLHGDKVRSRSGYTAHGYIDSYGRNAIAGHTHRLALVFRTQSGNVKFGMETGSLCKRKMKVPYMRAGQADWQQGIGIMGIDKQGDAHPAVMPIIKGKLSFNGKIYTGG